MILIATLIVLIGPFYNKFLFNRFSLLINNFSYLGVSVDPTLEYKLLSYYVLLKSNLSEIIFGSSKLFSSLVIDKYNFLPAGLLNNRLFISNLNNGRFSLNAAIVCIYLEYGLVLFFTIIYILRRFCNLFRPISLFVNYANILRSNLKLNVIISVFLLFSSFFTLLGAVPLTYPYPYLSLSLLFIIFDYVNKSKSLYKFKS